MLLARFHSCNGYLKDSDLSGKQLERRQHVSTSLWAFLDTYYPNFTELRRWYRDFGHYNGDRNFDPSVKAFALQLKAYISAESGRKTIGTNCAVISGRQGIPLSSEEYYGCILITYR